MDGVDFGQATVEGSIDVRYNDDVLHADAIAGTPAALTYGLTISSNLSLLFEFPRAFLARGTVPVQGPTGLTSTPWRRASCTSCEGA